MPEQTLGDLIREARVAKGYSLRAFAAQLNITPSYQSDIENNRRVPAENILQQTASQLNLDFEALMALAGRFGEQAERYMRRQPEAVRLFRKISEADLNAEYLKSLQEQVEQKRRKQE